MTHVKKRSEQIEHEAVNRMRGESELAKRRRKYGCECLSRREYEALYWAAWGTSQRKQEENEVGLQKLVAYKVGVSQSTISRWFQRLEIVLKAMLEHGITIGWIEGTEGWTLNIPTEGDPPTDLKPLSMPKQAKPAPIMHTARKIWYNRRSTRIHNSENDPF